MSSSKNNRITCWSHTLRIHSPFFLAPLCLLRCRRVYYKCVGLFEADSDLPHGFIRSYNTSGAFWCCRGYLCKSSRMCRPVHSGYKCGSFLGTHSLSLTFLFYLYSYFVVHISVFYKKYLFSASCLLTNAAKTRAQSSRLKDRINRLVCVVNEVTEQAASNSACGNCGINPTPQVFTILPSRRKRHSKSTRLMTSNFLLYITP